MTTGDEHIPPIIPAPEGLTANPDNPPHGNHAGLPSTIICLVIGVTLLLLRFYSVLFYRQRVRIEDYLGVLGAGAYLALCSAGLKIHNLNLFFVHQWDLDPNKMKDVLWIDWYVPTVYALTILFIKTAILIEWIHIFAPVKRNWFFWISSSLIAANAMFFTGVVIFMQLYCRPLYKAWTAGVEGTCVTNRSISDLSSAVVSLVLDLFIFILPQNIIWNLHTTLRKRIGLFIIFSVGLFGIICASGRVWSIVKLRGELDVMHGISGVYLWTISELMVAVGVYTLPAIVKIFSDKKIRTDSVGGFFKSVFYKRTMTSATSGSHWNGGTDRSGLTDRSKRATVPNAAPYDRMPNDETDDVNLVEFGHTRKQSITGGTGENSVETAAGGPQIQILRTTEISVYDDMADEVPIVTKPKRISGRP